MELKRVVVTGFGGVTPLGSTVNEFWENLKNGVSGAAPITRFDPKNFKTKFACEVKNFDPTKYIPKKEARRLDLFSQFALAAAEQAFDHSGLDAEKINHELAGVIWGSGIGGLDSFTQEIKSYVADKLVPRFSPFFIPRMIADIAAGHISMKYDFRGPNYATVSACASASHAIIAAVDNIRLGRAEVMITGGSEAPVNEAGVAGFNGMKAISTRNDDPEKASRPFDKDRDGFVIGEGGVALILEEYEHAVKRGATIYAEIIGVGMTADAYHLTAPHPQGRGAATVMRFALKDAGISTSDLDYINVHGTSTPLGDISETKAINEVFGADAYQLSISSTKSMTGHLLGAAGAIEALACILAMNNNIVPPTINLENRDPNIDEKLDLTPNVAKEREIKYALSNTFGFGGHNASIIFKKVNS